MSINKRDISQLFHRKTPPLEQKYRTRHRGFLQNDVSNLLLINITFGGVNRGDEELITSYQAQDFPRNA